MTARLLGAVLVALAGTLLGLGCVRREREHAALLAELSAGLGLLSDELTVLSAPLPEILERLGTRRFFSLLRAGFGGEPFEALWRRAAWALPLDGTERAALEALAPVIGRYDAPRQAAEIALVRRELDAARAALEARTASRARALPAMGAAAGAMLGILLL